MDAMFGYEKIRNLSLLPIIKEMDIPPKISKASMENFPSKFQETVMESLNQKLYQNIKEISLELRKKSFPYTHEV